MHGIAVSALVLVLVAAVVGGSVAIDAPLLAIPIVFAILVVWGGSRVAAPRGRPGFGDGESGIDLTEPDRQTP